MEPPYGAIARLLGKGQVVPFLGAGASIAGAAGGVAWDPAASNPPTGTQLAEHLAMAAAFPGGELQKELAKVASYYQTSVDRPGLVDVLREVFDHEFQPRPIHRLLAQVPRPLLIVTTNYDDLLEQAFREAGRAYDLVVYPTDQPDLAAAVLWWPAGESKPRAVHPAELPLTVKDKPVIYKMHGSIDRLKGDRRWDAFVITEEDYVEFLGRMTGQVAIPATFLAHFQRSRFLFLGYGLGDWNLRVMLSGLREPRNATSRDAKGSAPVPKLGAWAIQYRPSELERRLWDARGVDIYDVNIDDFVGKLRESLNSPSGHPGTGVASPEP